MKKEIGLWIDHRRAIIVTITDVGEEVKQITSNMEKHVRFTNSNGSEAGSSEDVRDRKFGNHLNRYYDEILAVVRDADSIQIFGPGEAKGELEKHLENAGLKAKILALETEDKMTNHQIAAKVRDHLAV
jgi:hypothetical protein